MNLLDWMNWADWSASPADLARTLLTFAGVYVGVRLLMKIALGQALPREWAMTSDAVIFGAMVLIAVCNPGTIHALGYTSSSMLFAGFSELGEFTRSMFGS
jgi:hypothetical protein